VSGHPIRLVLTDDMDRSRATVFFRVLLAIPLFIWLGLWAIVVVPAVILNWAATLLLGRSPRWLHGFLAAFIKYATQVFAYISLAANPYPAFDGQDGYPVDVTIEQAAKQARLGVAFRAILILPAALLVLALVGDSTSFESIGRSSSIQSNLGLLHTAAVLGWFAIMARGRMPRGLRDPAAYALSYGAQFWAYAFLLTDRYPDSDPLAALPELPVRTDPIRLAGEDQLGRSRLTVFFRLLLALPHLVWLALWGVLVFFAAVANWLAALATGRSPSGLHRFLSAYLRYQMHVYAFLYLVANPFPGFVGQSHSYPFEILIEQPERQNRWKTAFRLILAIPALILLSAYLSVAGIAALLGWFACLVRGEMPRGLRNVASQALRVQGQTIGYLLLLTDSYAYGGLLPDPSSATVPDAPQPAPGTAPPYRSWV
jgi:hypothetical protein